MERNKIKIYDVNESISCKHVISISSIFLKKKREKIFLVNIPLDKLLAINLQLLILLIINSTLY